MVILGWFHSGDLGFYDERGEIIFYGRMKEMIEYQYHWISPMEIETVLRKHPDVLDVAVIPIPHEVDLERPMAFVRKVAGSKVC